MTNTSDWVISRAWQLHSKTLKQVVWSKIRLNTFPLSLERFDELFVQGLIFYHACLDSCYSGVKM